ncbi:DUF423 domain-containing protein [bacterium]|nr:DUF423 domain-containing protein [bacterium]
MLSYNVIIGALFGIVLVVSGPLAEPYAIEKFADDLKSKAIEMPGELNPDGTRGRPEIVISEIDRQESAQRWQKYQDGLRYLAIHAVALSVLGLVATRGWGQMLGGIGFSLGTLTYGCGIAFGAVLNVPELAVFAPMGAVCLLFGWVGLMISCFETKFFARAEPTLV